MKRSRQTTILSFTVHQATLMNLETLCYHHHHDFVSLSFLGEEVFSALTHSLDLRIWPNINASEHPKCARAGFCMHEGATYICVELQDLLIFIS